MNRLYVWSPLVISFALASGTVSAMAPSYPHMPAATPIQGNFVPEKLSRDFLESWLLKMKGRTPTAVFKSESNINTTTLLDDLYSRLSSAEAIRTFRTWDKDDEAIEILVPFASGDLKSERFVATLTLANVVDNTNLCYVLEHLASNQDINANGRYNLLQIVRGIAGYAYQENDVWIRATLNVVKGQISNTPGMERTSDMILQIEKTLSSRTIGRGDSLKALSMDRFIKCEERLTKAKLI